MLFKGLLQNPLRISYDLGYAPRDISNALHGDALLVFIDTESGRRVDMFLDIFEMCQRFDFKERLLFDKDTNMHSTTRTLLTIFANLTSNYILLNGFWII